VAAVTSVPEPLPGALRWAVWLLRAEGIALGLLTVFLVYATLRSTASILGGLFVTVFALAGAVTLWALAVALGRRATAARGPTIVLQFMLLPIGYYMIQGGLVWLGVPVIALGLLVCGLLLSGPTNRALGFGAERA
jgi:hypothetical protein